MISEIASKLDNNSPNFNNYIHGRTLYNLKNKNSINTITPTSSNNSD